MNGIIDKKREQLKELDALAQSIFYDMFGDPIMNEKGWERIQINDCVIEMFIGPFGSSLKKSVMLIKRMHIVWYMSRNMPSINGLI